MRLSSANSGPSAFARESLAIHAVHRLAPALGTQKAILQSLPAHKRRLRLRDSRAVPLIPMTVARSRYKYAQVICQQRRLRIGDRCAFETGGGSDFDCSEFCLAKIGTFESCIHEVCFAEVGP